MINYLKTTETESALINLDGSLSYLIADDKIKETAFNTNKKFDKEVEEGTLYRADTLEELAEQLEI